MQNRGPGRARLIGGGLIVAVALGAGALALAAENRDKLERLNMRETTLTAEQGRNLNRFARLLTVLERFRRDPPPALLVSPDDAVDAARAAILVKAITPELQRRARVYATEAREIARQRRLAAVASEALFTSDSTQADHHLTPGSGPVDLKEGLAEEVITPPRDPVAARGGPGHPPLRPGPDRRGPRERPDHPHRLEGEGRCAPGRTCSICRPG